MILGKNFEVKFIKSKKFIDSGENESKGISFIIWLRGFIPEINDSHSLTDFSPLKAVPYIFFLAVVLSITTSTNTFV